MEPSDQITSNVFEPAKFSFLVDLDYQNDSTRSGETMQDFVLDFSNAIVRVLTCPNDYVHVISIEKPGKARRQSKANCGVDLYKISKYFCISNLSLILCIYNLMIFFFYRLKHRILKAIAMLKEKLGVM